MKTSGCSTCRSISDQKSQHHLQKIINKRIILILVTVGAVCALSSCTYLFKSENAKSPSAETATASIFHSRAVVAWLQAQDQDSPANGIGVGLTPSILDEDTAIWNTDEVTSPAALVRIGENQYFVGWISNNENASDIHWKIVDSNGWSTSHEKTITREDLSIIPNGRFRDIVAAYNESSRTILVAFLTEIYGRNCNDTDSACAIKTFPIDVNTGTPGYYSRNFGIAARGLDIAAGEDAFIVTFSSRTGHDSNGKHVGFIHHASDGTPYSNNIRWITGLSDCSDSPQEIIDNSDTAGAATSLNNSNYSATAAAYDTENRRFLIGYVSACQNSYYRARWTQQSSDNAGTWTTYGIDTNNIIVMPPFTIATTARDPLLAYNSRLGFYLAAYAATKSRGTIDDREMFYARFIGSDPDSMWPALEILADKNSWAGLSIPSYVSGDIVSERDRGAFYLVWEQQRYNVPCEDRADWSEPCELDWDAVSERGVSEVYIQHMKLFE